MLAIQQASCLATVETSFPPRHPWPLEAPAGLYENSTGRLRDDH
jgi:hypothetical protein